jgi:WD40 repeat protein
MSNPPSDTPSTPKARLFLSYGRRDAEELADRLEQDLLLYGYSVWRDRREIVAGRDFMREIEDGLRSTQLVVALLSPHSVRRSGEVASPDDVDSVCLDELSFARFSCKLPIVPVLAGACEPPFIIYRLDYVEMLQWRDFAAQYQAGFRRLLDAIEAALHGEVRYRTWEDRLLPWDFAAFLHEKRRNFCGREWLFRQIEDWRTHRGERALLITGDPGVGKSALVAQMVHQDPRVLAYHCCQAGEPETLRPDRFVRSLAAQIASRLPAYASALGSTAVEEALALDPVSAFAGGILTPLEAIPHPADDIRYVLIDALDEALAHSGSLNIVAVLASQLNRLPGWLRLVATTRKEQEVMRRGELSGLRAWEISAEDDRNLDDIERFLAHRLAQPELASRIFPSSDAASPSLSPHGGEGARRAGEEAGAVREELARRQSPLNCPSDIFSPRGEGAGEGAESRAGRINEIIRTLRDKSAGNFLWAQMALLGIERDQYSFDGLDDLPPGLNGLYCDSFQRRFSDKASYEDTQRILQLVVAAAEPLTAADLGGATGLDPEEVLPRALRSLAAFLHERDGRFVFYHKSLADWLTDPTNRGTLHYASPRRGHERLAEWCWDEYRRGPERMPRYALRHLPSHLIEVDRWDDLAAVLRDLPYLEVRAEAGQVFDMAVDFTRAGERLPVDHPARRHLRLISQAVGADVQFLARHPTTLFQCLWNRCWWYDCPDAAAHYDPPPAGWPAEGPPWARPASERLAPVLESWRAEKKRRTPGFRWVRSLRPPPFPLGGAELACLRGHTSLITSVAFSPNGRRLASGSLDKTVRIWDAQTGAELTCLRGHTHEVTSVSFSPDGHRLVTGSGDRTVRVWDTRTGAELARFRGHTEAVSSVAFSPDGRRLASGSSDETVRVWDAQTGAELDCLRGHTRHVTSVAFSPDGRRLVSGSPDKTVRVWDAQTGAELACLRGHTRRVWSVACSTDGRRIVCGSHDHTVRVWDAQTGAELACLRGHTDQVTSVAFSPDGRRVVSASHDDTVRVWDAQTGAELACLRGHTFHVNSVSFSPDGGRLVSGSGDRTVRVWDAQTGAEVACRRGHTGRVESLAFSPDGGRLVSGSDDRMVRIWDAQTGAELACLRGHAGSVHCVAFSPDGWRLASGSYDGTVRVWDAQNGAELACLRGHAGMINSVAFSPDGRRIVSGSDDKTVRVWDAARGRLHAALFGRELACLRGHTRYVLSVAFSTDGRRLVSGSWDSTVRLWDSHTGAELACLRGHTGAVTSVAFSPDGRRLVSASGSSWRTKFHGSDQTVRVWDAGTGTCLEVIQGSGDSMVIAASGDRLPPRVVARENETVIEPGAGGDPIAWFPAALDNITTHPSCQRWAGADWLQNLVYVIELEGEPEPREAGRNPQ